MKPIQLVSPFLLAAGLALRLAGMDNVRILQGGFSEWKAKGGFEANKRAIRKSGK